MSNLTPSPSEPETVLNQADHAKDKIAGTIVHAHGNTLWGGWLAHRTMWATMKHVAWHWVMCGAVIAGANHVLHV